MRQERDTSIGTNHPNIQFCSPTSALTQANCRLARANDQRHPEAERKDLPIDDSSAPREDIPIGGCGHELSVYRLNTNAPHILEHLVEDMQRQWLPAKDPVTPCE
jgi:hypothetical protein